MPMCPCMKMSCTHAHTRIAGSEILMYDPGSAVSFKFDANTQSASRGQHTYNIVQWCACTFHPSVLDMCADGS